MMILYLFSMLYWHNVISEYTFETKFIDVPLDHFSFTTNKTFKLRYLVHQSFHIKGGPVFIYTGNEGDITMFAQNTGFLFDIAPEFNALVVFAEHRYYGESLPFGNESYSCPEKLGYLSSSQALADFVYLIEYLRKTYLGTVISYDTFPFIAFGGSYGGMLAAWLRMKYPNSVLGAIASSAPIWFFDNITPCEKFYGITTDVFGHFGANSCNKTIKKTWGAIRNITQSEQGKKYLSNLWKLCSELNTAVDVDKLVDWLSNIYVNLAMMNYPYPTTFMTPLPAYPVKTFCDKLNNSCKLADNKSLVIALGEALQVYNNYTGETKCNNINIASDNNMRDYAWDYQACVEMIMPMCSTEKDMFEVSPWNFNKFSEECFKKYGVRSSPPDWVVLEYGGKNLRYFSNIVFSNGMMDPWSSGGVLQNISAHILAVNITDGAHHSDLRASNPADSNYVKEARIFHKWAIKKWLNIIN